MTDYAVISDIHVVDSADMTEDDFLLLIRKSSPVGYADFEVFIPGDYTYQNAIFKHGLIGLTADRPRVTSLVTTIDVPDVFDRGENVIPAAATTVNFNRVFQVPPEVFPVLKVADDTAWFRVSNITTTGFDITIKNSGGTVIGGTIAWSAVSY